MIENPYASPLADSGHDATQFPVWLEVLAAFGYGAQYVIGLPAVLLAQWMQRHRPRGWWFALFTLAYFALYAVWQYGLWLAIPHAFDLLDHLIFKKPWRLG